MELELVGLCFTHRKNPGGRLQSKAIVRAGMSGEEILATGEGNSPQRAFWNALCESLKDRKPEGKSVAGFIFKTAGGGKAKIEIVFGNQPYDNQPPDVDARPPGFEEFNRQVGNFLLFSQW